MPERESEEASQEREGLQISDKDSPFAGPDGGEGKTGKRRIEVF